MKEGRNNSPSWLPHLLGALGTFSATWLAIRNDVPSMVQVAVRDELATHRTAMVHHVDSIASDMAYEFNVQLEHRARVAADSIMDRIGFIAERGAGPAVYRPRITVQGDSTLRVRMDTLAAQQRSVMRQLAVLTVKVQGMERDPNKRNRRTHPGD